MTNATTLKKVDDAGNHFTAGDGRFTVDAMRTDGGYIREWHLRDTKTGAERFCKTRSEVKDEIANLLSRELPDEKMAAIREEIKAVLHCCRDTMRIRFHTKGLNSSAERAADPKLVRFDTRLADYGDAFGVLRALKVLGYGDFGGVNVKGTLSYLMAELEDEVLKEEGFGGDGKCERCFKKYRRDDARPNGEE